MQYRKATLHDIGTLIQVRKKQLADEGLEPINIDQELFTFFQNKLSDGTLLQWLAEDGQEVIACGAVLFHDFPPSFTNRTGKKAYITNMYTAPAYRGQGIATNLLSKLADEAKSAGVSKMWLGASEMGRPVYKKFGFTETGEYLELDMQ
ncbi:GNAT family N-acetyltransferase [Bacillus massiliglaciei]|uniref:GNAT family N-acetyltransferase n=1 Tax=Bacillus massiliglaciei TaxID=1816693 RepID=UPI000DA6182B|nr:GNAT family N-acetyltransferase [Bacillus massiliglaciei]